MQRQLVQLDFSGGLDQRTYARYVQPGKLLTAVNVSFDKAGALEKRRGFVSTGALGACYRMAAFQNEWVAFDGANIQTYDAQKGAWEAKDKAPEAVVTCRQAAADSQQVTAPDVAYGNGYTVTAWVTGKPSVGGDVVVTVENTTTGAAAYSSFQLATATCLVARALVVGTTAFVVWSDSTGNIKARTLDLTNPTGAWTSAVTLQSDSATPATRLAARPVVGGSTWIMAYITNAGTDRLKACLYSGTTLSTSSVVTGSGTGPGALSIRATSGEQAWIGCAIGSGTAGVYVTALNPSTLASNLALTVVYATSDIICNTSVGRVSSTVAVVCASLYETSPAFIPYFVAPQINTSGSVLATAFQRITYWACATSEVIERSGKFYCALIVGQWIQTNFGTSDAASTKENEIATAVISDVYADLTTGSLPARPVAAYEARLASLYVPINSYYHCSGVANVATDVFVVAGCRLMSAGGRVGTALATVDFATKAHWQGAELGLMCGVSGGVPSSYDGALLVELGYLVTPAIVSAVGSTTGGSLAAGTYQYSLVYEWTDARGAIHRSAPSVAVSVTTTGTTSIVTLTLPNLTSTNRGDAAANNFPPVWLVLYRTDVNGTTFYRMNKETLGGIKSNVITGDVQTFVDSGQFGNITTNPVLYTTGGVLPNFNPPSAKLMIQHQSRWWLAGCDDPKAIWYSKTFTTGEAPGFNEVNLFTVDDGGAITALASMDDKLVVFKEDRIFIVYGDGGNDLGQGSSLQPPQKLATDRGCIESRSVVLTPQGLMFQSRAGIYLLTRGLEVQYVGGGVEDTLAANPTITSAVLHPDKFEVRFTCNSSGSTGVVLVFDYLRAQWLTHTYYDAGTSTASTKIGAATNHLGVFKWASPSGYSYAESSTDWRDAGTFVGQTVETADFKLAGLQSYMRIAHVQFLGASLSPHTLKVEFARDAGSYDAPASNWTDTQLTAMPLEQVRVGPRVQKCATFRVRITETAPTVGAVGTGRGLLLAGLLFDVGAKQGAVALPAAQKG